MVTNNRIAQAHTVTGKGRYTCLDASMDIGIPTYVFFFTICFVVLIAFSLGSYSQ